MSKMTLVNYSWTEIASMNAPRVYASVTCYNGSIYVVGGCDEKGQPVNTLEVYDSKENTWTKLKGMPTKRAAPIVASIEGKIIAIGGVGPTQAPVDAVEIYSIAENKWKRLQMLSEPLMGMAFFVRENKIYIFGGMAVDTNPRDHFKCLVITPEAKEKWQAYPPMPTARYAASSFYRNSNGYVLGGRQGKVPVAAFEVYNFDFRQWVSYPDIPSKRVFPCYVNTDKYLVSLGGLQQNAKQGFSDACEFFATDENEKGAWGGNKRASIPTKRGDFTAVVVDNQVVVTGGLGNDGKPMTSTESFDPGSKKWKRLSEMNVARSTSASVTLEGRVYVFGGITLEGPSGKCEVFALPESGR